MLPAHFATSKPNQLFTSLKTALSFRPSGPTSPVTPNPTISTAARHSVSLKRWPPINTPHPSLTSLSVSSSLWLYGPFGRWQINWLWKEFALKAIVSLNRSPPPPLIYFSPPLPIGATLLEPLISLAGNLHLQASSNWTQMVRLEETRGVLVQLALLETLVAPGLVATQERLVIRIPWQWNYGASRMASCLQKTKASKNSLSKWMP